VIKKVYNYLSIVIVLFFVFSINSYALENTNYVDFTRKGSIEIILKDNEDNRVSGVEITLYHIANAVSKDNNLSFENTSQFSNCSLSFDDDNFSSCITSDISGVTKVSNEEGIIKYNDLELGLYLVRQENKKEGYSSIKDFLIKVPEIEENEWIYDIIATPKTDIYRLVDITVNKVWNTSKTRLPSMVTIDLYKSDELIDRVILNNENNWTYTWNDLEKSDNYKVLEIDIPKGYTATYSNYDYVFTVTNIDVLAPTGQIYYPIIIFGIAGIIFILLGILLSKRKINE